jgi:hypothetical protein
MDYNSGIYRAIYESEMGARVWEYLTEDQSIIKMETACELGKPAVEPLSAGLLERFGNKVQDNRTKQMIGHMVKQILFDRGYIIHSQNSKVSSGGLFNKATSYVRLERPLENKYRQGYLHGASALYNAMRAKLNPSDNKVIAEWFNGLYSWQNKGLLERNSFELPPSITLSGGVLYANYDFSKPYGSYKDGIIFSDSERPCGSYKDGTIYSDYDFNRPCGSYKDGIIYYKSDSNRPCLSFRNGVVFKNDDFTQPYASYKGEDEGGGCAAYLLILLEEEYDS